MRDVIFLLLLVSSSAISQKQKVGYFLYDKDWKEVRNGAVAAYVVQSTVIGDSLFVDRIFKSTGYLWKQESFSDADRTIPHGQFGWYDDLGRIDSSGYVNKKRKTGNWSYYNDTLGLDLLVKYDNGRELERRDYINKIIRTADGVKTFDEEKRASDSLKQSLVGFKAVEKEASFEGGAKGYKKYLERNLVPPKDLVKTGTVKLQFIINKTGKVENLLILRSVQFSADVEALRVLSEMPHWTPAYQNGKNVIYQAIQYLTFQVL